MTDTTGLRERELLLYDTWTEGLLVKVYLRLRTFRIDDFSRLKLLVVGFFLTTHKRTCLEATL